MPGTQEMPYPGASNLCILALAIRAMHLSLTFEAHVSLFSFLSFLSLTWLSIGQSMRYLL